MGTMAEFFASRPTDVDASDPLASRAESFPAIEVSGVTPEFLADLEGLVIAKKSPKISTEVASAGDEGPWLNVLSDAFVERLAGLDSRQCEELATRLELSRPRDEAEPATWSPAAPRDPRAIPSEG